MDHRTYIINKYQTATGKIPFDKWYKRLDSSVRAVIAGRLTRVEHGHISDAKSVGDGVLELRFHIGPGYRIYFGLLGERLVILLAGGDKGSQMADIRKAKQYLREMKERSDER